MKNGQNEEWTKIDKKNAAPIKGYLFACLFVFYGISTFVGYLMLNTFLYE